MSLHIHWKNDYWKIFEKIIIITREKVSQDIILLFLKHHNKFWSDFQVILKKSDSTNTIKWLKPFYDINFFI